MRNLVVATLLAASLPGVAAYGGIYVPPNLHPGDTYYLAFATHDTHNAASADIATYNQFVQFEASQNPALTGTNDGVQWRAIASTPTVSAISNLGLLPGVPIYELRPSLSELIVSDASSLVSTARPSTIINFDQFGHYDGKFAWTGTLPGGIGAGVNALGGSSGMSIWGREEPEPWDPAFSWLDYETSAQATGQLLNSIGFYAVSTPIIVPVPEPESALLLLIGAVGFGLFALRSQCPLT